MAMKRASGQSFLIGWRKWLLFARVALHVKLYFAGEVLRGRMPLWIYPRFLYRAYLFLRTVRHNKIVKRGSLYKLQLYIPAYPSRAFFHTLGKLYRREPGPVSVVLSMTRACTYRCAHCYQNRDRGHDLEIDLLVKTAREMQDLGVSMFDIEGGEPLLRMDRLTQLIRAIDDRGEVWINTTGDGLTGEMVSELRAAGLSGVMVSLHSPLPDEHDAFTGVPGSFDAACRALKLFGQSGAFTAVNCCPSAETIAGEKLVRVFDLARALGCAFVQVIHGKAAGGWLGQVDQVHGAPNLIARLRALHLAYNTSRAHREHPCIAAQVFDEDHRLFGCTAGGVDRFYVGADGEVQPCEFLNVSFGNVQDETFRTIFRRMRSHFRRPCSDWLCCTQAAFIAEIVRERGLARTPVPWEITREFVGSWDRGAETPLYRKLGIYR
jgi:MoaA/NifB/PqqE/SkfB family radical SAM enzyme